MKLGIEVSETTVAKYMVRHRKSPSQTWRTFLKNHAQQLVSVDFFVVPTLNLQLLFVFVLLEHPRRRVVHCNVTAHPTTEWTAQQMREAFPWAPAPRFLIRDRDGCLGRIIQCDSASQSAIAWPVSPTASTQLNSEGFPNQNLGQGISFLAGFQFISADFHRRWSF
ncbi:MAG: hypothetical protein O7E51_07500 [Acidobacteria bacterium]|nr:hypothetical protein [Acidobacteriota bacterium]